MLTADELSTIPLFSSLPASGLAELGRGSADIHLNAGEYAVHEGEEPALFVVLAGAFEAIKLVDGIERKIGMRVPGKMFGEIPLIYGTQFQASFRAAEPSRVLRVDAPQYYALAALSPEFANTVRESAGERIGGLRSIVAEPRKARVTLLGNRWDTACLELRRFLVRNQITFDWLMPDTPDLAARWAGTLPAESEWPALRLSEGATLIKPQPRQLAERLGLQTRPRAEEYDTVIIGGGPAGLAAAVYGASEGLRTLVVEREAPGGQAGTSSRIENYLGFPSGISGDELASRALRQAQRLGAEILVTRRIVSFGPEARTLLLDDGDVLKARTVILATGVSWRRLAIDGFDRLIGKGIYYGAARSEASITQGLDVHLIGAGNSAGQAAMYFANHARTVTLIVRGDAVEKSMSQYLVEQIRSKTNIRVALRSEVHAIHGNDNLTAIDLLDRGSNTVQREDSGGLFVFIGADAETEWLPPEIARDERGYILTGADLVKAGRWSESRDPYLVETSVPGVFACGDVRYSPVKRVASAVGEGSMAIAFVHQYLQGKAGEKKRPS
jgi:thioredoxin reductase (NADPH)